MSTRIPVVLSAQQLATHLGISSSTLAKMRLSGHGPVFIKLGRRVFYRPEDIEAWVNNRRFNSTSEFDALARQQSSKASKPKFFSTSNDAEEIASDRAKSELTDRTQ